MSLIPPLKLLKTVVLALVGLCQYPRSVDGTTGESELTGQPTSRINRIVVLTSSVRLINSASLLFGKNENAFA